MKDPIYTLLEKHIDKTINESERALLRQILSTMDHDQLSLVISELWDNYDSDQVITPLSFKEFDELLIPSGKSNSKRSSIWRKVLQLAAVLSLPLFLGLAAYKHMEVLRFEHHLSQNLRFSIKSGDCSEVLLPDGTTVVLNSASSLSYPADYGLVERNVSISGEAFLKVAKDKNKPFIVDTRDLQVRVLGTTFNISAYDNSDVIETTLLEGSVQVTSKLRQGKTITIKPNEKVTLCKKDGRMWAEATEVEYETAWVKGDLVFRSATFIQVVQCIERRYGLNINVVHGNISTDRFTGTIQEKDIRNVLQLLQKHFAFSYVRSNDSIEIMFNKK